MYFRREESSKIPPGMRNECCKLYNGLQGSKNLGEFQYFKKSRGTCKHGTTIISGVA